MDWLSSIDPALVVSLVVAGMGGGGISSLIRLWWERRDGTEDKRAREVAKAFDLYERERDRVSELEREMRALQTKQRVTAEHASDLRRMMMERCGVPASELPAWPSVR